MSLNRKPVPKTQVEISQQTIEPYLPTGKGPVPSNKRRENQRTRKNDEVKDFTVGLQDIDSAIVFYFNNVIRPSVVQNGVRIPVPFIYGSPERWKTVQAEGHYRDKDGKIQTPIIMFKRNSVERNRTLGNKMDANTPLHYGIFETRYSKKNIYDQFSSLTNRIPVKEYYGVIMPDYVNLTYTCIIFTEYVEQMNKIIEAVNFASDSYWGDPERFKFRTSIDSYSTAVELVEGQDRTVKTTFEIKMAGYIINDQINASVAAPKKMFSKSAIKFKIETAGTSEILHVRAKSEERTAPVRFYDTSVSTGGIGGMTTVEITYAGLSSTAIADTVTPNSATFNNRIIANPPPGFPNITEKDFQVYINGVLIPDITWEIVQNGNNITVTFTGLEFTLESRDQIVLIGKFT